MHQTESRTDYLVLPKVTFTEMRKQYWFAKEFLRATFGHTMRSQKARERLSEKVNGQGTGFLANKYAFVELLGALGFMTPKQVLLAGTESLEEKKLILGKTFTPDTQVYCKPVAGTNSSGLIRKAANEISDRELEALHEPTILQESIQIQTEFRYVWHRDADGKTWTICFEKKRPQVVGDGTRTLLQLINAANLPIRSRLIIKTRHAHSLLDVVPVGEPRILSYTGNPTTGGYEALPSPENEQALTLFVNTVVAKLEEHLGLQLTVLCLDIGVTDVSAMAQMDQNQLQQKMFIFENQFPFSALWFFSQQSKPITSLLRFYNSIARSAKKH